MPRVSPSIWEALQHCGLLPRAGSDTLHAEMDAPAGNLLPALIGIGEQAVADSHRAPGWRRSQSLVKRLREAQSRGAVLSLGMGETQPPCDELVGHRLVWWPRGVPTGQRVAVISSRLGRWSKLPPGWFTTLRGVLADVDPARQMLVTARDTTLAELIERWAFLRHVPLLQFDVAKPRQSLRRWWTECLRTAGNRIAAVPDHFPALVSPPVCDSALGSTPVRDAILVAGSDQVVVCRVRSGGNIWRLLERRLAREVPFAHGTTTILTGPGFTDRETAESLQQRGACVRVVAAGAPPVELELARRVDRAGCGGGEAEPTWMQPAGSYLVHCTRAIEGPWPDQERDEYLDALLSGEEDPQRTPLATLMRIACQQQLLATGRAIRGRFPVVCFTGVPLAELSALRTFRAHRGRWDFEPYGIAISCDWLIARGARPVSYGDEAVWESMDAAQCPYFQRRFSGTGNSIDWSIEQEWRCVGSLDLHDLPAESAFLFVPTVAAAAVLRPLSRWPVWVLPAPPQPELLS